MELNQIKSRRTFLRVAGTGIAVFFIFLWNKLNLHHLETSGQKNLTFPFNRNKPVSFNNDYIVVNRGDSTTVFSAHCTHLGCKIDKMEGDHFVCPCHGSQFDLDGNVLKGPAFKNLAKVSATVSEDGNNIVING